MASATIEILHSASGSRARICPERGFNCYSFQPVVDGQPQEVLWAADDFLTGSGRPSASGIPLLFPFAGRIGRQQFTYRGRDYRLASDDRRGNAIHGFVLDRPWQVTGTAAGRVTARFHAGELAPSILEQWPNDFVIEATYQVQGATLASRFVFENPGPGPLPCWFGTHPYFRLPLGPRGEAERCLVTVPAAERWELVEMLPSGRRLMVGDRFDLRSGLPFAQTELDDVYTSVTAVEGRVTCAITDAAAGRRLLLIFDDLGREVVVYNPPHRQSICLEPYTAVPDAFRLGAEGQATGLWELAPGERRELAIEMRLEAI